MQMIWKRRTLTGKATEGMVESSATKNLINASDPMAEANWKRSKLSGAISKGRRYQRFISPKGEVDEKLRSVP